MSSYTDAIAAKYAALFVESFNGIDASCWDKPWMRGELAPQQNIAGDAYRGTNRIATLLRASKEGFRTSVWGTFLQWKDMGVSVNPGEHSTPVSYFDFYVRDKATGKRSEVTPEQYKQMSPEEREGLELRSDVYNFNVFNASQTDLEEKFPDAFERLVKASAGEDHSVDIAAADAIAERERSWICPVAIVEGKAPLYHRGLDVIWTPPKEEYKNNRDFYASLFRSMAHSTGAKHSLNRATLLSTSVEDCAKEELICEFASAIVCTRCGLSATLERDNLQYLKIWTERLSAEPKVIYSILKDATKVADMIVSGLGLEEHKGVDMRPVLPESKPKKDYSENKSKRAHVSRAAAKVAASAKKARQNH